MKLQWILGVAIVAATVGTSAQGKFDGTWNGTAGDWTIRLAVAGTKGSLSMACFGNKWEFDIPIGAEGAIDTYVRAPDMARRQLTGWLPEVSVPPGGTCRGGTATLSK